MIFSLTCVSSSSYEKEDEGVKDDEGDEEDEDVKDGEEDEDILPITSSSSSFSSSSSSSSIYSQVSLSEFWLIS